MKEIISKFIQENLYFCERAKLASIELCISYDEDKLEKALKALEIAVTTLQQYSCGEHTPVFTDPLTEIEELLSK